MPLETEAELLICRLASVLGELHRRDRTVYEAAITTLLQGITKEETTTDELG